MKQLILIIFTIIFSQDSVGQIKQESKPKNINLSGSFNHKKAVFLSEFVKQVSFIPLETNPETVLTRDAEFGIANDFIIVNSGKSIGKYRILLFDRKSGRFIKEIGKQGRGPNEYMFPSFIPFNPDLKVIYALGSRRELIVYNLDGKCIDKILPPVWNDIGFPREDKLYAHFQLIYVQYHNTLDTNIFVGYVQNMSGTEKRKIILFSKDGFINVFPNYLTYRREDWRHFWNVPGQFAKFYKWNNQTFFIEAFCDTLYQITKDKMIPRYYFNFGKINPSYSNQGEIMLNKHWSEYFFILHICENLNCIFFTFIYKNVVYLAILYKKDNSIIVCSAESASNSAIKDDINGLIDVIPQSFTPNNEMVYIIQPVDLLKWLELNPEKAVFARSKLPWIDSINEMSNPIIAVGNCKE